MRKGFDCNILLDIKETSNISGLLLVRNIFKDELFI